MNQLHHSSILVSNVVLPLTDLRTHQKRHFFQLFYYYTVSLVFLCVTVLSIHHLQHGSNLFVYFPGFSGTEPSKGFFHVCPFFSFLSLLDRHLTIFLITCLLCLPIYPQEKKKYTTVLKCLKGIFFFKAGIHV